MILLHSFEKKTQKTPPQDLELAHKRRKEIM
jgi:phage-related protein